MKKVEVIKGFSKLSKSAKVAWVISNHFKGDKEAFQLLDTYTHSDGEVQKLHDEFIENTLSNFYMPFGVAPNFLIDGAQYTVPMTIEESSVVAAAAKAASFWMQRGGFKTEVVNTTKIGHVHFVWRGKDSEILQQIIQDSYQQFIGDSEHITANMTARGGGVKSIQLVNKCD